MKLHALAALALLAAPAAFAAEINVSYGPEFAEDLADDYGEREGAFLADEIREDLVRELGKSGVEVARIDVVIVDAKPNKPTHQQLSDKPGLSYAYSRGVGGMKMTASAFDANGDQVGELTYKWYETDLRNAGLTTWQDAQRASSRFARKFAKELQGT